jgi:hypothetical protein
MPCGTIQRDTIEAIGNFLECTRMLSTIDLQVRCISINIEGLGVDFTRVVLILSLMVFFVFRFKIMGVCRYGSWFVDHGVSCRLGEALIKDLASGQDVTDISSKVGHGMALNDFELKLSLDCGQFTNFNSSE